MLCLQLVQGRMQKIPRVNARALIPIQSYFGPTHTRADDESVGPLPLTKGDLLLLLQAEHDYRQGEDECLTGAGECDADHVTPG